MALWYNSGKEYNHVSVARKTRDSSAFLCCGGPSLSQINSKYLNGPNRTVFGLNNVYPQIRPDVWMGMDDPKCYRREIFWEPFTKIMRGGYQERSFEDYDLNKNFNLFYADCKTPENKEDIFKLRNHDTHFVWHKNSFATALHIILWMGFDKIYLFGCDFNNSEKDYFNEVKLDDSKKKYNGLLYSELNQYLEWFSKTSPRYAIKVYSCSPHSKINDYLEYKDYLNVISDLEKNLPKGRPLFHSTELK